MYVSNSTLKKKINFFTDLYITRSTASFSTASISSISDFSAIFLYFNWGKKETTMSKRELRWNQIKQKSHGWNFADHEEKWQKGFCDKRRHTTNAPLSATKANPIQRKKRIHHYCSCSWVAATEQVVSSNRQTGSPRLQ